MTEWQNYNEVKYIMDNIFVGCKVLTENQKECIVTSIKDCNHKIELFNEKNIDDVCQMCIGQIGLDDRESDCQIWGGGFPIIKCNIIKLYNEFFREKDFEI